VLDDEGRALVEEYANVAEAAARSFWKRVPRSVDLDELRSVAFMGLVQAAERYPSYVIEHGYDPANRDFVLAYLSRRIHGSILDHARTQDWVTRAQRTRLKAIDAACPQGGTTAELAAAAGLSEEQVLDAQAAKAAVPVSLDTALPRAAGEREEDWSGALADPADDLESAVAARSILAAALTAVRSLPEVAQVLLAMRYHHGHTLADIAEALGLDRQRALQLHTDAILRVHEEMLAAAAG
jgi:RNA polymerase sigma factor FliA